MKTFIRLAMLVILVVAGLSNLPSAQAQAQDDQPGTKPLPAPEAQKVKEISDLPTDGAATDKLIIKFRDTTAFKEIDTAATSQAASALGGPVQPIYTLSMRALQMLNMQAGVSLKHRREMSGGAHVLTLPSTLSYADVRQIAERLAQLPDVEYVEPVQRFYATAHTVGPRKSPHKEVDAPEATPNDPDYTNQWHYKAPITGSFGANLPGAWDVTTGSLSIYIAVIDTGSLFTHPDLSSKLTTGASPGQRGYDFISDLVSANDGDARDPDPADPGDWDGTGSGCPFNCPSSWHGSHVAGTIGAATNNSAGVSGVNWLSKVVTIRALGKGGGDTDDIVDGIRWAAGMAVPGLPANPTPVRVINMSLGANSPGACSAAYQNAINDVVGNNVVVVVAAGNSNANSNYSPGNCANVITVAATNRNGNRASYSNYGTNVEIAAPGGDCPSTGSCVGEGVLSTLNNGTTSPATNTYEWYDGTSMATPHVAGIVSLMLSANPNLNPYQVLSILQNTATPFPNNGGQCDAVATRTCGSGIVNAAAAVIAARDTSGVPFKKVYLPMVLQQTSGSGGGGSLVNGGFEDTPQGKGWTVDSTPTDPIIQCGEENLRFPARTGQCAAWMGGFRSGIAVQATLQQQVTVPNNQPYLVFYQQIDSNEANCNADYAEVRINGTAVGGKIGICNNTTEQWQKKSVDLNAYKGQSVTLTFYLVVDNSAQTRTSSWQLDDIVFSSAP
jgi:serine protease